MDPVAQSNPKVDLFCVDTDAVYIQQGSDLYNEYVAYTNDRIPKKRGAGEKTMYLSHKNCRQIIRGRHKNRSTLKVNEGFLNVTRRL